MDSFFNEFRIVREALSPACRVLAGKAYRRDRAAGGTRTSTLADFSIGAHAAVTGRPLLTRDMRHYKTYFPTLTVISPNLA